MLAYLLVTQLLSTARMTENAGSWLGKAHASRNIAHSLQLPHQCSHGAWGVVAWRRGTYELRPVRAELRVPCTVHEEQGEDT